MSDEAATKPAKKKGGLKKLLMLGVGAGLLAGGGIAAGMYVGKTSAAEAKGGKHEDPDAPKLVEREGKEQAPEPAHGGGHDEDEGSPDPSRYKSTYYPIEQTFTSNLRDSDSFVQVGLGVSTFYDSKVTDNLKNDEIPIRSAVLMTLADTDADSIGTPQGKTALQKALKKAINDVLVQREGFGGVDGVYFTSFVVQ